MTTAAGDAIDPAAVLCALGAPEPAALSRLTGGMDAALWQVCWPEGEGPAEVAVLRVLRREQADVIEGERIAMALARQVGVPVPTVLAHGAWNERPAMLLSWCSGEPAGAALMARPDASIAIGEAMGRMQARIHRVRVPPELVPDGAARDAWIGWCGPAEQAIQKRLRGLLSLRHDIMIHLDYHPQNVLVEASPEGATITGVIDWTNVQAGDPRADLARTVTLLRVVPIPPVLTFSGPLRRLRRRLFHSWRRGYEAESGRAFPPPAEMAPFYAWAGALMLREMRLRADQPGGWLREEHLKPIERWTRFWRA